MLHIFRKKGGGEVGVPNLNLWAEDHLPGSQIQWTPVDPSGLVF